MRIATVKSEGRPTVAVCQTDRWYDLSSLFVDCGIENAPADLGGLLAAGYCAKAYLAPICARANERHALVGSPDFLMPFRPGKVVGIGRNYRAHVAEFDNKMPGEPIYFCKATTACIGPEEPIVIKDWYGRVDHEGELGVVIGRRAKDVSPEKAPDYIAGYTIVNDVTAREVQKRDIADSQPWFRSKSLDTFCPLGPVLTLREELSWPVEVDIVVRVNGEIRQQSNTAKFIFDIPALIAAVTRFMTLEPGDIIATGTPEGVSPLHPGDSVAVEVPGIGILRNPVVAG